MNSKDDQIVRSKRSTQLVLSLACLLLIGSLSGCGSLESDSKLAILNKMKQSKYEEAITLATDEIKSHPSDPDFYAYRGVAGSRLGKSDLALAAFRKAIELDSKSGWYYRELGEAYVRDAKYKDAIEPLTRAKELMPKSDASMYSVMSSLALVYLRTNEPQKSVEFATEALELNPQQKYTLVTRALAYLDLFEMDKALADVNKSLELDDKYPGAYVARSSIYLQLGELKKSRADAEKALQLDKKFWEATEMLVALSAIDGDFKAAEAYSDQLVKDWPANALGYADKANCLFAQGKFEEARKLSDKALSQEASGGRALYIGALLAGVAHDKASIDELANRMKTSGAGDRRADRIKATAYLYLGDYKGAADIFTSLLEKGRKTPNDYRLRAKAYEMMHQNELAEKDMKSAIADGYSKLSVLEQDLKLLK